MRYFCVIELNGDLHEIVVIKGISEEAGDDNEYYFWRLVHNSLLHEVKAKSFAEVMKKLNVLYCVGFSK